MTGEAPFSSVRRMYWLTGSFGVIGFVWYFAVQGPRPALAFALGALGSFGNLGLFEWLSHAVEPGERTQKPWQAGAFISRYLILLFAGYAIVKLLGVNPLAVILGLLTSTAAVLTSAIVELVMGFFSS